METLDSYHTNTKRSFKENTFSGLRNKQNNIFIQVLAHQLDKDRLSILHYAGYYNNLFICRKLAELNCGKLKLFCRFF